MSAERVSREQAEAWRQLAEQATPGPWLVKRGSVFASFDNVHYGGRWPEGDGSVCTPWHSYDSPHIAASREAVPALVSSYLEALDLLEILRRGSCWCEVSIGNPNQRGHTDACKRVREFLGESKYR